MNKTTETILIWLVMICVAVPVVYGLFEIGRIKEFKNITGKVVNVTYSKGWGTITTIYLDIGDVLPIPRMLDDLKINSTYVFHFGKSGYRSFLFSDPEWILLSYEETENAKI